MSLRVCFGRYQCLKETALEAGRPSQGFCGQWLLCMHHSVFGSESLPEWLVLPHDKMVVAVQLNRNGIPASVKIKNSASSAMALTSAGTGSSCRTENTGSGIAPDVTGRRRVSWGLACPTAKRRKRCIACVSVITSCMYGGRSSRPPNTRRT